MTETAHWRYGGHSPAAAAPRPFWRRLETALARELDEERGRWFYWLPVLFGAGIGVYFSAPQEPPAALAFAALLGASGIRIFLRRGLIAFLAGSMILAIACGFAAAKLRAELVRAPLIEKSVKTKLEGWAERWEQTSPKRGRLTLRLLSAEGLEAGQTPFRVRISVNAAAAPAAIGEALIVPAVLTPLAEPVAAGAFDFARQAWFLRLGASGFAIGQAAKLEPAPAAPLDLQAAAHIANLRSAIARRIEAALPGNQGAIAQALIMGERAQMSAQDTQALRDSGLYHVISISGLHMTLVAGSVFWLIRLAAACLPALVLRYDARRLAAFIAISVAFVYFLLSGAAVATQRSFIMIAVMFLAIALNRPAVTLRNVAFAALIILALFPESLLDVSFQMSFAATAALIAWYERFGVWFIEWPGGRARRWAGRIFGFFAGLSITTIIAGAAVAPFSAYHFYNFTSYSVLGNLLGMPLVTLIVMPMALVTLAALPFGLEYWPLQLMGQGIELMLVIARFVSGLEGAVAPAAAFPLSALNFMALGGLWLLIWRGRWRYLGLAAMAAGVALMPMKPRPDVLIGRDGALIAVRDGEGRLQTPQGRKGAYSLENWLKADGDARKPRDMEKGRGFRCDPSSCVIIAKGRQISFLQGPAALAEDCARADLLIAPFALNEPCPRPALIIDRRALRQGGAHAVYIENGGFRAETAARHRGERPWSARRPAQEFAPAVPPQDGGDGD